jgi:hypothetical protein
MQVEFVNFNNTDCPCIQDEKVKEYLKMIIYYFACCQVNQKEQHEHKFLKGIEICRKYIAYF